MPETLYLRKAIGIGRRFPCNFLGEEELRGTRRSDELHGRMPNRQRLTGYGGEDIHR